MLAPLRRKDGYETRVSTGKSVPQNNVLGKYHGITMQNPTEVTGGPRSMLLKMLTQLERFLHLAEAVLDNLGGKGRQESALPEFLRPSTSHSEKSKGLPANSQPNSMITLAERGQIRFSQIPVIKP